LSSVTISRGQGDAPPTASGYVLLNLGTEYVVISGVVIDQFIGSAVRNASDLRYL